MKMKMLPPLRPCIHSRLNGCDLLFGDAARAPLRLVWLDSA